MDFFTVRIYNKENHFYRNYILNSVKKIWILIFTLYAIIIMLLSVDEGKHCFRRCTASWLSLVLNIVNQRGPGSSVSPPYRKITTINIHFRRATYVISAAFRYVSVKFQLNVWKNHTMFLLNYTLPIEVNLPILPWLVKKEIFVFKCIVDVFLFPLHKRVQRQVHKILCKM